MSATICGSHLSLFSLPERKYQLSIVFSDEAGREVSVKEFIFHPTPSSQVQEVIWDVYSHNISCAQIKSGGLFVNRAVQGIKKAFLHLSAGTACKQPWLLVLDIQGGGVNPHLSQEIGNCEEIFCQFFAQVETKEVARSSRSAVLHEAIALFVDERVPDFILLEGSLKKDLLERAGFSDEEKAFLQRKGPEGSSVQFCQLAEVFMNGFKFGQEVVSSSSLHRFTAAPYLANITERFPSPFPCSSSIVLYPPLYQEIYAMTSPFFQALSTLFHVSGHFDPQSAITTVAVRRCA